MPANWLNVPHHTQVDEAGCLLACIEMVTEFLGKQQRQRDLATLLEAMPEGIPASRVKRLESLGFRVVYAADATIDVLKDALQRGLAPIVFFTTEGIEYWDVVTNHAAVLVGLDDTNVYLNDPAFADAPQVCSRAAFELGWAAFENRCALIAV